MNIDGLVWSLRRRGGRGKSRERRRAAGRGSAGRNRKKGDGRVGRAGRVGRVGAEILCGRVGRVYIGAWGDTPAAAGRGFDCQRPAGEGRHYAPAGLSGWKIAFRNGDAAEKAGCSLLNPTIISRIASTASWPSGAEVHHGEHNGAQRTRRGRRAGGSRQGDAGGLMAGKGPRRTGTDSLPSCPSWLRRGRCDEPAVVRLIEPLHRFAVPLPIRKRRTGRRRSGRPVNLFLRVRRARNGQGAGIG